MEHYIKLFKSFGYAFSGLFYVIKTERNMRIHLTCMIYMFSILSLTDWFVLTKAEWAILILTSAVVISLEIVNTAVENAVNLANEERTLYGKIAKDAAAGAVLVSAIASVAVGLVILFQVDAFIAMYEYFKENLLMLAIAVLSLIPATLFIFFGLPTKRK